MNTDDLNFAYKVRRALNENLESIPSHSTARLAAARTVALTHMKGDGALHARIVQRLFAGVAGQTTNAESSWFARLGVALPAIVLVIGLTGIYYEEENQRIQAIAEIDTEVLADELPIDAYLDDGFNAYLAREAE